MTDAKKSPIGAPPGQKVQAVGISWYREADYAAARAIMADAHKLPPTFAEWLAKAEKQVSELERGGHKVVRAVIDPEEFPVWCRRQGLAKVDADARRLWASDHAARQVGL